MKKKILALSLILILLVSLAIPAAAEEAKLGYVTDQAGLLTTDEWKDLTDQAKDLADAYGIGVYLVLVRDYSSFGDTMEEAAKNIHRDYALGCGSGKDTILLLMSMEQREFWLLAYGDHGNTALTDWGRERMIDGFIEYFREDQWLEGFEDYYDTAESYLESYAAGEPFDKQTDPDRDGSPVFGYAIGLAIGALIAIVVCLILKAQMNTAVAQKAAEAYVPEHGIEIRNRTDLYTHTTVTRTKVESDHDSSGGTTVDSDGYSGSGGSF